MTQIVLNPDQARQLSAAKRPVVLTDTEGHELAYITTGFSPAEIAEAERLLDSDGPWSTTSDVLDRLPHRG